MEPRSSLALFPTRIVAAALLLLVAILIAAACGGGEEKPATPGPTDTPAPASTAAPTGAAAPAAEVPGITPTEIALGLHTPLTGALGERKAPLGVLRALVGL